MEVKIDNLKINYIQYGKGRDILLLHGWGQNIEMMKILGDHFEDRFRLTILDFPGFGKSDEPDRPWDVGNYANLVNKLVKKLKIKNPIIVGHSFGGRVAIKYASMYEVDKLVLFGAPCIREQSELPLKVKVLKSLKKLPGLNELGEYMKKYIGSEDYRNATPMMREILVNTVNEDLSGDAVKIKCPTLLIWGTNDSAAPINDARKLEKILKDGALIELPGTHYAYIENINRVVDILNNFF